MKDLEKTIKHFVSQQKRYMTQHDGKRCERIDDALEALRYFNAVVYDKPSFVEERLKKDA